MRSQTSYLVVMMCMMGCFAVVRMNPVGLLLYPANIGVAMALLLAAPIVALRRPGSYAVGLAAAGLTALAGALGAAKVRGVDMPGSPLMWIVIGLYIAFRLSLVQQGNHRQALAERQADFAERQAKARLERQADEPLAPAGVVPPAATREPGDLDDPR